MTHSNSVAVVTGSARNIGRATAIKLGELGFNVVVHTNNDAENLQKTEENESFSRIRLSRSRFTFHVKKPSKRILKHK